MATVFILASAVSSKNTPSPDTANDFSPFNDEANKAPAGDDASGVVTSIALLLIVIVLLLMPASVENTSDPPPSPILRRRLLQVVLP